MKEFKVINENMHNKTFANCKIAIIDKVSFTNCLFYKCTIVNYYLLQIEFIDCKFNYCYFNLSNAKMNNCKGLPSLHCPEKGSFIGYKKAIGYYHKAHNSPIYCPVIIKLEILEDSLRSSAFGNKCRCSKAKILSITNLEESIPTFYEYAVSQYQSSFIYKVGEIVEVNDFNTNRWNECSTGIHFFMTKEEAINY